MKVRVEIVEDDGHSVELHAVTSHPVFGWQALKEPRPMILKAKDVIVLEVPAGTSIIGVRGASHAEPEKKRPDQLPDPPGTPFRAERILDGGGRRE